MVLIFYLIAILVNYVYKRITIKNFVANCHKYYYE